MTKTRTITVRSPLDLLAMVPYVMGFHPEDSIVVVTVGDAVDGFHARLDLPNDPDDLPVVVETITDAVERNGVRRVAIVVYGDDEYVAEMVSRAVTDALGEGGVTVAEALRTDGDRWFSLTGCTEPCCPEEGTPYDLRSHPLTAQAVLEGQVTLSSRQALEDSIIGGDPEALEAAEEAVDRHNDRLLAAARPPVGPPSPEGTRKHLVQEGHWVAERVRTFLADAEPLSHDEAGRMWSR